VIIFHPWEVLQLQAYFVGRIFVCLPYFDGKKFPVEKLWDLFRLGSGNAVFCDSFRVLRIEPSFKVERVVFVYRRRPRETGG